MKDSLFKIVTNADIDTIEDIFEIDADGRHTMLFTFVVGTANLSDFDVLFKAHPSGDWVQMAGDAADYTTPNYPVLKASGDLNSAAAGATVHWLLMDIKGAFKVKVQAAGTSSTIAGHVSVDG